MSIAEINWPAGLCAGTRSQENAIMSTDTTETVLYDVRPSMFRNRPVVFVLCVLLAPLLVGLVILIIWRLDVLKTRLVVTNRSSTLIKGILSKRMTEVPHNEVSFLEVTQSFGQRLRGVGTIAISSNAQEGVEIQVDGIVNPNRVAEIIRQHQ